MKKTTKILLATIVAIIVLTLTNTVQANYQIIYQSNTGNYVNDVGGNYIYKVRNMEANGQVMGLNENERNSDLTSIDSNKIDVHLIKNTEYGALILLSASAEYGKQGEGTERYVGTGTTTGNAFGVYMNEANWDWTAAGGSWGHGYSGNINSKYINRYPNTNIRFAGDALLGWHGGWLSLGGTGIVRGNSGSVFSANYYTTDGYDHPSQGQAATTYWGFGRAAVVCGTGF